ncbi:MAG: hypothetical protein HOO96_09575 [Polyangiaceae bacterium]|nr:hypothetical protein [Polyangiaceae bacterium]
MSKTRLYQGFVVALALLTACASSTRQESGDAGASWARPPFTPPVVPPTKPVALTPSTVDAFIVFASEAVGPDRTTMLAELEKGVADPATRAALAEAVDRYWVVGGAIDVLYIMLCRLISTGRVDEAFPALKVRILLELAPGSPAAENQMVSMETVACLRSADARAFTQERASTGDGSVVQKTAKRQIESPICEWL